MHTPKAQRDDELMDQAIPRPRPRVRWTPSKKGMLDFLQEAANAQIMVENRRYEIIVYGATGFTGRLVCLHFARYTDAGSFRWALGGRRLEALEALMHELTECGYPSPPSGIVVADASDDQALSELAKETKLVLTTCGPYAKLGPGLVRACAEAGSHYVDITGEAIPFARNSISTNDAVARKKGAQIVHCAGYDSVPSDSLARLANEALNLRGERCIKCVIACDGWETRGTASGGTVASVMGILAHLIAHPADLLASFDQDALSRDILWLGNDEDNKKSKPSWFSCIKSCWWLLAFGYDNLLQAWHAPFVMAFCNHKIVRRTQRLRAELGPHEEPRSNQPPAYKEVLTLLPMSSLDSNWGILGLIVVTVYAILSSLGAGLLLLLPNKILFKILPSPGTGPPAEMRKQGKWRFQVAALGDGGSVARGEVVALSQDPGYASTAVIVAEVARSILEEDTGLSGVLTPAVAAPGLPARLEKYGIKFSVKVSKAEDEEHPPPPTGRLTTITLSLWICSTMAFLRLPEVLALSRTAGIGVWPVFAGWILCTVFILARVFLPNKKGKSVHTSTYYLSGWRLPVLTLILLTAVSRLVLDNPMLLWQVPANISLSGKVYAITGANSGLGKELTRQLVELDAEVVMLCRSAARCRATAQAINSTRITVGPPLDISDLRSVESAGRELKKKYNTFDGLVLNAGFYPHPGDGVPENTAQGLEMAWGAMHIGHVLFETLVPSNRIVSVGSEAHHFGNFNSFLLTDNRTALQKDGCNKYNVYTRMPGFNCAYLRAKRANIMHSQALAAKYGKKRTVVAVTPGFVQTEIIPKNAPAAQFSKLLMRPLRPGALSLLRATIDESSIVAGKTIDCMTQVRSYQDICMFDGGCDLEEALSLHQTASKLATTLRSPPPPAVSEEEVDNNGTLAKVLMCIAASLIACLVVFFSARSYREINKMETQSDLTSVRPPQLVQMINTLVHSKALSPLFDTLFWTGTLVACGLASPFVFLYGLYRWLRLFAGICIGNTTVAGDKNLAVVITGCDSGFGYWLALALSRLGFTVFAGLLSDHSGEWYSVAGDEMIGDGVALPRFVQLDVTNQDQVDECVSEVERWIAENPKERRLLAVVNNAGRGGAGHAELLPDEVIRADMEVNCFGVHRVCRAFLPLLRQSQGSRILIVASMAGVCPGYAMAAYTASKHAVVALAASFRLEQSAVPVSVLLPSFHPTPIFQTAIVGFEKTWQSASPELQAAYGGEKAFQSQKRALSYLMYSMGWDPQRVVDALIQNVISRAPPPGEVPVGLDAKYPLQIVRRSGPFGEFLLQKSYFSLMNPG